MIKFYFEDELDIRLIADCFKESFKRDFDEEYWRWRFKLNPTSKKIYISYILEDNKLASYYAVSPCTIEVGGKKQLIALSNMTMTSPQFQGKGYFKLLASELYGKLKQDGFIAVYGFANHNSHYGFRKYLGWNDLGSLNMFGTNKKLYKFQPRDYTYRDSEITHEDVEIATEEMICHSNKIALSRDLIWRFIQNPQHYFAMRIFKEDRMVGLIIYKLHLGDIDIMEYFYISPIDRHDIFRAGIWFLLKIYKRYEIKIWSNLHTEEHIELEKMGFIESEFNSYFGIVPLADCNEILDIKDWHIRFMDSDIF